MDVNYLRTLATQLETTAKALRQLADGQELAQTMMAQGCDVLMKDWESVLRLYVPARKALRRLGVKTVGELTQKTAQDLLNVRGFGVTNLNKIREELSEHGLKLAFDD